MAMKTLTILLAIFAHLATATHHHAAAPAPAVDCSTVILNMADCLSYVTIGSTVAKPEGTCCSGLKTVLKSNAECLCEAFKNSAQLGIQLNVTKAMGLPTVCKLSAPPASNCQLPLGPGGAPAHSPMAVSPTSSVAGARTMGLGASELAPAPAPASSGSSMAAVSLVLTALFASLALF